jgi:hypothetical protein
MRIEPTEAPAREGIASLVDMPASEAHPARGPWIEAACRGHRTIVAGLASALFLGGWSLPGVGASVVDSKPLLQLAGAVVFLAKTGALLAGCAWARWLLPPLTLSERSRATALKLLPLSLLALGGAAAWAGWARVRLPPGAGALWSGALTAALALATAALIFRTLHAFPRGAAGAAGAAGGGVASGTSGRKSFSEERHMSAFF